MAPEHITLVIERLDSGLYTVTAPELQRPVIGGSTFDALSHALQLVHRLVDDYTHVAVRRDTLLSAEDIVGLIRASHWPTRDPWWPTGWLDLTGCHLIGVDLSPPALDKLGVPDHARFKITGGLSLQGVIFRQAFLLRVNLEDAVLANVDFRECILDGARLVNADLRDANLSDASLSDADLRGSDLRSAKALDNVAWRHARLEKTWFYRRQIEPILDEVIAVRGHGSYLKASETYLSLKSNFDSLGNFEDASWAYLKEQQMEKAAYFPTSTGRFWLTRRLGNPPTHWWWSSPRTIRYRLRSAWSYLTLFVRGTVDPHDIGFDSLDGFIEVFLDNQQVARLRWARNWAFELLTGYGERPQMPILWGAITMLAFALVFSIAGNVSTTSGGPSTHDFMTALTYSIAAFATVGFNDLQPVGRGARLITAVEAMLGIGFFALFVYTLGNRMSRS